MKTLDAGHKYELEHLDGANKEILTFVKREGKGFPGNIGHYEGTNLQEVFRACIDRLKYLDNQIHDSCNIECINHLRQSIYALELRAARRHGKSLFLDNISNIEDLPVDIKNGHLV
jgi:hypothetical protein